jgi:hypothetical protein
MGLQQQTRKCRVYDQNPERLPCEESKIDDQCPTTRSICV